MARKRRPPAPPLLTVSSPLHPPFPLFLPSIPSLRLVLPLLSFLISSFLLPLIYFLFVSILFWNFFVSCIFLLFYFHFTFSSLFPVYRFSLFHFLFYLSTNLSFFIYFHSPLCLFYKYSCFLFTFKAPSSSPSSSSLASIWESLWFPGRSFKPFFLPTVTPIHSGLAGDASLPSFIKFVLQLDFMFLS